MKDVFEVQDEIARKIAEALRITLSPQEQQALAAKPTDDLHAYDLYLRGKSHARRMTRQDLHFALQMFESAVAIDPKFALAHAAIANASVFCYVNFEREQRWLDRANASVQRAVAISPDAPEVQVAEGWIMYGSPTTRRRAGVRARRSSGRIATGPMFSSAGHFSRRDAIRKFWRSPTQRSRPRATTTTLTCRS